MTGETARLDAESLFASPVRWRRSPFSENQLWPRN